MTPSDFATLAAFLYGRPDDNPVATRWRHRLADDAGMRADNMRRLIEGRRAVPPGLAEFLLRRAADRWLLRHWTEQPAPAGLSPEIAADLDARISAARSWSAANTRQRPTDDDD